MRKLLLLLLLFVASCCFTKKLIWRWRYTTIHTYRRGASVFLLMSWRETNQPQPRFSWPREQHATIDWYKTTRTFYVQDVSRKNRCLRLLWSVKNSTEVSGAPQKHGRELKSINRRNSQQQLKSSQQRKQQQQQQRAHTKLTTTKTSCCRIHLSISLSTSSIESAHVSSLRWYHIHGCIDQGLLYCSRVHWFALLKREEALLFFSPIPGSNHEVTTLTSIDQSKLETTTCNELGWLNPPLVFLSISTHPQFPSWVVCMHQERVSPAALCLTSALLLRGSKCRPPTSRIVSANWPKRV